MPRDEMKTGQAIRVYLALTARMLNARAAGNEQQEDALQGIPSGTFCIPPAGASDAP